MMAFVSASSIELALPKGQGSSNRCKLRMSEQHPAEKSNTGKEGKDQFDADSAMANPSTPVPATIQKDNETARLKKMRALKFANRKVCC